MSLRRLASPLFWLVTLVLSILAFIIVFVLVPNGGVRQLTFSLLIWIATISVFLALITGLLWLIRLARRRMA